MKAIFCLLSIASLLSLPALAQSTAASRSPAEGEMEEGLDRFRNEDYTRALLCFEHAEKLNPSSAVLHNLVGITLSKVGQGDKAEIEYLYAIRLDPKLEGPHTNLGVSYLLSGQYEPAEKQLKKALVISPQDPFVHFYLATLYLNTARLQDALREYAPAQSLIENNPDLMVQFAKAELRVGSPERADAIVSLLETKSAVGVHDEYELAGLFREKRLYPAMLRRLQRIAQDEPTSWEAKYDVGIGLLYNGECSDAAGLFEGLVAEKPEDANVLSLLGVAYEQGGETSKALDAYQRALRADPNNPERYLDYTRLLMEVDRFEEAANIVESGIDRTPRDYALKIRAGAIKFDQGEMDDARQIYEEAIRSNPNVALGYYGLAQTYLHEGNDRQAADILIGAVKVVAPDAKLEYLLGLVSEHSANPADSILAFSKAIELDPNVPEPHYELGKVYLDSGNLQKAQYEFERTVALQPQNPKAFFQLSRIYEKLDWNQKARDAALEARRLIEKQNAEALEAEDRRFGGLRPVELSNDKEKVSVKSMGNAHDDASEAKKAPNH